MSKQCLYIVEPDYPRWFDKKFCLNEKQIEALKSGNLIHSIQMGIDLDVIKAFRHPENLALLM